MFGRRLAAGVAVAVVVLVIGSGAASGSVSETVDFAAAVSYPVNLEHGVAIAELTGDGRNDVVVSDSAALHLFPQNADGSLGAPTAFPVYGSGFGVGDLTGDGLADLAVAQPDRIDVFSRGLLASSISLGSHPEVIEPADLNGDGRVDLAVATDVNGWGGVFVLLNTPDGWTRTQIGNSRAIELRVGDMNADGRLDVVELPQGAMTQIPIAYQLADGSFRPQDVTVGDATFSGPSALDVGELTGDGRADLAVVSDDGGPYATVEVVAQTASGSFAAPVRYPTSDGPNLVSAGDINGDGRDDVTVVYSSGVNMGIYLQRDDGTLGSEQLFPIPYSGGSFRDPNGIAVGDTNADGLSDVAIAYNESSIGLVVVHQRAVVSPPPDTTAPETTITAAPASTTTATGASFDFSSSETGSSFSCSLDTSSFSPCLSPQGYSGLTVGSHSFRVAAADASGNTDATPASYTWTVEASPPSNDNFANATLLTETAGSASGTTLGMTKENGEPNHAGNAGGKSIWYRWTAPASGTATFTTAGSSFDTLLAVYTGTAVNALSRLAQNDDAGSGTLTSRLTFSAAAGATYRIAVDGYGGASGSVTLNWTGAVPGSGTTPPGTTQSTNDNFASAGTLSGNATASTTQATKETGEPDHAGNSGGHSLWWTWVAPASGTTTISLASSNFDTLLAIYTGTSLTSLRTVAANDDANNTLQSEVRFTATSGSTYRIAVDGYAGATGAVTIHLSQP